MLRRPPLERLAARVVTGPLGHLHGGALDLGEVLWAIARAHVRLRLARTTGRRAARP